MKQITIMIVVKDREPGLLSIGDNRVKSLVPFFDGTKIIDQYLTPFLYYGFGRITIIADRDTTGVKDYVVFNYGSQRIRVINESDIIQSYLTALKLKKNECLLLLRADALLFPDWVGLKEFLLRLSAGNYEIVNKKKDSIGYLLHDVNFTDRIKERMLVFDGEGSKIDTSWELLEKILHGTVQTVEFDAPLFRINTVFDYFAVHFSLMSTIMGKLYGRIGNTSTGLDEEEISQITTTGHVRNSHIAHSCSIEGYVENSILFSNVKIGRHARIKKSIIMNHNHVGSGAVVSNTILCDNGELFSRVNPNIGEEARIGEDNCNGENENYPDYINKGLTLIGQNVEIPKRFIISKNCYIASGVDKSMFKGRKSIKMGDSVFPH